MISFKKIQLLFLVILLLGLAVSYSSAQTGADRAIVEETPVQAPATVLPPHVEEKKWVEVPKPEIKPFVDANDFRDPFFLLRGSRKNAEDVLQPGTTIDGIQFNSYSESGSFIKNFYRESNFSMESIFGDVVHQEWRGGCLRCHRGIEQISSNHKFSCARCHAGNEHGATQKAAHQGMVSNPSDLDNAPRFCGKCHEKHIQDVTRSKMATGRGMINTTRYAWGAQPKNEVPYSLRPGEGEQALPGAKSGKSVDGFLRTKCLRCHLDSESPHRAGDYRATGCASCHMIYANDGLSMTYDRAVQAVQQNKRQQNPDPFSRKHAANALKNQRGYPLLHQFTTAIPSVQCEHCHNNNGVGNEFEGLFGKHARPKASMQTTDAEQPVLHGRDHEFLLPDIHRERGMHCIDCHGSKDLKGPLPEASSSRVEVRCEDCHGTQDKYPDEFLLVESDPRTKGILKSITMNPILKNKIRAGDTIMSNSRGTPQPHIRREDKLWFLFSKVTGKKHPLPVLKDIKPSAAHSVGKHMQKLECHACHARWSAGEWGLHAIREQTPKLPQWKNWTFADPTLQSLLRTDHADTEAKMLDWTTAESRPDGIEGTWLPGIWWDIFSESGWDTMVLGKNARGKYSLLKPRYQYFITEQKDGLPNKRAEIPLTLDGQPGMILQPYAPHTIRKNTRSCEDCHDSALAAGLGDPARLSIARAEDFLSNLKTNNRVLPSFQLKQLITESGDALQTLISKDARFLNAKEIASLNLKTEDYRALRYMDLRDAKLPRLLLREEFPFDVDHKKNVEKYGIPRESDLTYNPDNNQFTLVQPPTIKEPEKQPEPSPGAPEIPGGNPSTGKQTDEGSQIIEFFRNIIPELAAPEKGGLPTSP